MSPTKAKTSIYLDILGQSINSPNISDECIV